MILKEKFSNVKENKKFKALFNDITPLELILICIPFIISFSTNKAISRNTFGVVFLFLMLIFGFGFLFIIGWKWRFLFFGILLFISILLIWMIGQPFEYWMLSGRDEEIRNCIEAILNRENPYYTTTHDGLSPSNLPFSYFLYLPVYIITGGYSYFMSIVIMALFCFIISYAFIDTEKAYLILPTLSFIIFSDYFFLEAAMNSDLITIQMVFLLVLFLISDEVPEQKEFLRYFSIIPKEPKKIDRKIIVFAFLFGSLLASRMHFWLIALIIPFYILKIYGLKKTIYLSLITIATFLIWMIPFILTDIYFFFNVAPIAHNCKMTQWRAKDTVIFPGTFVLDFLNQYLNYGEFNCVIITIIILIISLVLGLIKCENKFHLYLIISICYFIYLFFYLFILVNLLLRDYVSIAALPLTMAFLYADFGKKRTENLK